MRLLLVRLSSLGDIATALPIGEQVLLDGHELTWVVEERFAALFDHANPRIRRLVWRRGVPGLFRIRGRGRSYDALLDVQGNWKSGLISASLGCERRFGLSRGEQREKGNAFFLDVEAAEARGPHVLDRALAVVERCVGKVPAREALPRPPYLHAADEEVSALEAQLDSDGIAMDRAPVAVILGRAKDPRAWPLTEARKLLLELGARAFAVLGPEESEDPGLREGLRGIPVLAQTGASFAELVALGGVLARSGGLAVGHDGGAMQMLYASGAETLFLFGPQDPRRTGPSFGATLSSAEALDCRPCLSRHCGHPSGPVCMARLPAREVLSRIG